MKTIVILSVLFVVGTHAVFYRSKGPQEQEKIAIGVPGRRTENLDFCYISVTFYQKKQTCGCMIWNSNYVITTARCVVDCSEGIASNITVTFPLKVGAAKTGRVTRVIVPDGIIGEGGPLPKYDPAAESPFTDVVGNNVAILKLATAIVIDDRTASASADLLPAISDSISLLLGIFKSEIINPKYRACGVGVINNQNQMATGVLCTDVNILDPATEPCRNPQNPTSIYTLPDGGVFCVQWSDRDNNICPGDFGGPIYIYEPNPKGGANLQIPMGLAIGSPDARPNAPCLGGQTIYAQYFTENVVNWITSLTSNPQKRVITSVLNKLVIEGKI